MDMAEQQHLMNKVIAKAWADTAFRKKLIDFPAAVLGEEGIAVPEGIEVKIVENTPTLFHIVLPITPVGELPDEEADRAEEEAIERLDL